MIDIYELEQIKRITNRWYHNRDKLPNYELHKMLEQIRNFVR